jgi:polyhydroxybutyrate depolymerase
MKSLLRGTIAAALLATSLVALSTTPATASAPVAACSLATTGGPVSKFLFKGLDVGPYRLTVPPGLSGSVPLLVDLHGGGGFAEAYEFLTGWPDYAMRKKSFILVAPNSEIPGFWQPTPNNPLDGNFIKAVVKETSEKYCVDPKRIYVSGHSLGGIETDRMMCDNAGLFAAAAPYAGAPSTMFGAFEPSRSVPIEFFHGDLDPAAPTFLQEQNRDSWIARQHCSTTPTRVTDSYGYTDTYGGCDGGQEIKWRLMTGQSHDWPTGAKGEDMRDRMWAFFNAHPLP